MLLCKNIRRKTKKDTIIELVKRFNTRHSERSLTILAEEKQELVEEIHRLVQLAYSTANQRTLAVLGKQYLLMHKKVMIAGGLSTKKRADTLQLEADRKAQGKIGQKIPVLL